MLLIAGTVPLTDLPPTMGEFSTDGESLIINGQRIPRTQGTGAMISAALATTSYLGIEAPHALVAGDAHPSPATAPTEASRASRLPSMDDRRLLAAQTSPAGSHSLVTSQGDKWA